MQKPWIIPLLGTLAVAACAGGGSGEKRAGDASDTDAAVDSAAGMANMPMGQGMGGMAGMPMDTAMHGRMQAHMQAMQGASGDSLRRMLPMHRNMADSMLARMRQTPSAGAAASQALADSVQEDMRRMEGMTGTQLQAFMPEHRARAMRLMQAHGGMKGSAR